MTASKVDVTDESRPFRAEIEEILVNHSSTRFAKVLKGMNRGLTDAEMATEAQAAGEPILADSIAAPRIGRAFSIHTFAGFLGGAVAPAILRHRLIPNFAAQSEGVTSDDITRMILEKIPQDR